MPTIDLGSVVGPQGQQGNTGPAGPQGVAGPSLISASTQTTLTGVLAGDGNTVGVRAVDSTPTNNSTNLVSSGGVYTKITTDVANAYQRTCNPNLLDNWYFAGGGTGAGVFPVNQREVTSYTSTSAYQFDRWKAGAQAGTTQLTASGVSLTTPSGASSKRLIEQVTELKSDVVAGMKVTLSVLTTSGLYTATDTLDVTSTSANRILLDLDNAGSLAIVNTQSGRGINVNIRAGVGITLTVIAVKLELGTEQTLAHNEGTTENPTWVLNEIPNYAEELAKCQRYLYYIKSGSSNNLIAIGEAQTATSAVFAVFLPVSMVNGNATVLNDTVPRVYQQGNSKNATAIASVTVFENIAHIVMTASSMTAGNAARLFLMANNYLGFSKEL